MSDRVKRRKAYDASGRQEQARATRARVLQVATRMFLEHGFAATGVPEVARAAGVSSQNVYRWFGNKPGLIKAVFDTAIAGDDEPTALMQREALTRVREAPDPREKLRLYGRFVADTAPRHAPVQLLIRTAAAADPEAALLWDQLNEERLRGMTMFARGLSEHLRPGVSEDEARDLLWAHNSPDLYHLLVQARGWSPDRFGDWIAASLTNALLP